MRPITLKIAAGSIEAIPVNGRYVRNGDTSPTITVADQETGDFAILAAGDAVNFANAYRRLLISHDEATEQTVVINFGFGQILTARTVGTVSVDGVIETSPKNESSDGQEYLSGERRAATVSNSSYVSLMNASDSGKKLIVKRAIVSGYGSNIYLRQDADGLTSAQIAAIPSINAGKGRNKVIGGSDSAAGFVYSGADTTYPGSMITILPTDTANPVLFSWGNEPIILMPGYQLYMVTYDVNTAITGAFEWSEEVA